MKKIHLLRLLLRPDSMLLASIFMISATARADTVGQDGILRDALGDVLIMDQATAISSCAKHKMHLPTIRELAVMSQAMGDKILETNQVEEGELPDGYGLVMALSPKGVVLDKFYHCNSGYVSPDGDLGKYLFWSSSLGRYLGYGDTSYGYVFDGGSGWISGSAAIDKNYLYSDGSGHIAARCAPGP